MNKILSIKRIIIIISTIFGLIILLLFLFVIFPLLKSIDKVSSEMVEIKEDLVFFEKEVESADTFAKSYDDLQINPEKIDSLLVDSSVPIEIISFFESLAKEQDLSINILPISLGKTPEDPFDSIGFKIEMDGPFINIMRFVEKVESAPYFILIKSFYAREGGVENKIISTIEVKVYVK